MDKALIISKFAANQNQKNIFAHILDLQLKSENRNTVEVCDFLSESDLNKASEMLKYLKKINFISFGGYTESERKLLIFLPEYYSEEDVINNPKLADISFIEIKPDKFDKDNADLSHRSCLGALMSLGIERDKIGDILSNKFKAEVVIKSSIRQYIIENLTKVGRFKVTVQNIERISLFDKVELVEYTDTVVSMRLDAVVAAAFNMSRSDSSEAILHGCVSINGVHIQKASHIIRENDKISLRGKGRIIIKSTDGFSKKGRIRFTYLK